MSEPMLPVAAARARLDAEHPDMAAAVEIRSDEESGMHLVLHGRGSHADVYAVAIRLDLRDIHSYGWREIAPGWEQRAAIAPGRWSGVPVEVRGYEERTRPPEPPAVPEYLDAGPDTGPGPEATTELPLPAQAVTS